MECGWRVFDVSCSEDGYVKRDGTVDSGRGEEEEEKKLLREHDLIGTNNALYPLTC